MTTIPSETPLPSTEPPTPATASEIVPSLVTEASTTVSTPAPEVISETVPDIRPAGVDFLPPTVTTVENVTASVPTNKTTKIVDKLSDQIRSILKHFQEVEPTGFPGQTVLTDPMPVPDTTADMALGTGFFYNMTVHGLSNFTVEAVNMLLDEMQVRIYE